MTKLAELTPHALSRLQERCEKRHIHFDDGSARCFYVICERPPKTCSAEIEVVTVIIEEGRP